MILFVAILASMVFAKVAALTARESVETAARQVPALMAIYGKSHKLLADPQSFMDAQRYLQSKLSSYGAVVLIVPARVGPPMMVEHFTKGAPPSNFGFGFTTFAKGAQTDGKVTRTLDNLPGIGGKVLSMQYSGGPLAVQYRAQPPPIPGFVRLVSLEQGPVTAAFPGGNAALFIDPARLRSYMLQLWAVIAVFGILAMAGAWRIAIVVANNTLEPLLRTTRALNRFGDGDFTPEAVSTSDRSELGELARAYNRAVAQITHAFDERSRAEAEMRQFVADAGHQLRTPLTVIMGYLSAMETRTESPRRATVFKTMLAQSRRMKTLIDDLITLARLEHAGARADGLVDVNALASRIPSCFDEGAQDRVAVIPSRSSIFVRTNESDLLGALCALVDNALKYAGTGPVEVTIAEEDDVCAIRVADRGPGMSEQDLRKAFDRFYRGTAAEGVAGTGLGLPIIRKSIERSDGTIWLENRDGGGLVCTIRLSSEHPRRGALATE